jgi:hypothetical protein
MALQYRAWDTISCPGMINGATGYVPEQNFESGSKGADY